MKVLIIEDELHASQRLEKLIRSIEPGAEVIDKIDTVKRSVEWFNKNPSPDLVFMDIQLADGISFLIFEQCEVKAPVIFTTAFDEYALKAFKVNSIDYLLKPIDRQELEAACTKFKNLSVKGTPSNPLLSNLDEVVKMLTKKFKTRFVIKVGEHLKTIEVDNIQYFYSKEKTTFCATHDNRHLILDYTLEQLEGLLDSSRYFRINRKYIVSSESIADIISYTNSRLKLILRNSQDQDIIIARERVQDFKAWLDR